MNSPVLIVDDSLTVRMDLTDAMENAGFVPTACDSMQAARQALWGSTSFALIVLDVLLPDGDGIELLSEVRAHAATSAIPVILLSTEAQVQDRVRGLTTGADEYIGKPYDRGYVVARARELVRRRHMRQNCRATVLVIDDSPTFCNEIRETLERAEYEVLTAASGEEGLHSAINNRPQAVIVDNGLPGIDGNTVVRRMREDAALRRTPCLLLTASEDRAEELRALEAGADNFVRKSEDFSVILARLTALLRTTSTPSAMASPSSVLGPKKILAVDDSPTYLEELASQMRQEGYDLALAPSGEQALQLLAVQAVDCILLDVLMPTVSGLELCRKIKQSPGLRDIPLIMLTSLEGPEAMLQGMNSGADDYVLKSSSFEVIRARVRAALRRQQFETENRAIREELLRKEMEAKEARAREELAETRAGLLAQLQESEERVRIAADAAELGIWFWDLVTGETVWSDKCKALFGVPADTVPSYELFLNRVHPDDRVPMEQVLREALSSRKECEVEYRVVWPDGSTHWIAAKGRALYDDAGKAARMTGVVMDVTNRKQTDAALIRSEKLASVGRMAATMAHEINNPLEAVVNSLYLISSDESLSPDTRAHIEVAERELDRVVHLTKQTLGFYRENSRPAAVNLSELADELVGLYSRRLTSKRITVDRTYRGSGIVQGIAGELRQIISNLMTNSIDALPPHGTMHVRISDCKLNGYSVRITVADNGCGISAGHLQSIFEPFFTTKKEVGTGLGLWVTKQIVQKHGGTIRVRSNPGSGTVFSVYLPATVAAAHGNASTSETRAASAT